jgi:hypothetical protein
MPLRPPGNRRAEIEIAKKHPAFRGGLLRRGLRSVDERVARRAERSRCAVDRHTF